MRIAPAQSRKPNDEGFILIEVLVSALILAMVAAAVLAVLSSTTHSAASERLRSQAAALAQEDQARLRSLRISTLNRLDESRENIELDGTNFTVRSEGTFISAATNEVACSGETSATDYVRITSSVSSSGMNTPVVVQSTVAPSNGSLDQNHGTLSFSAKNARGLPLSGVSISGTGAGGFSGYTDSTGCANFADLPAGNYQVKTSANGMINMKGESTTTKEYGAPAAATQTVALTYDVAATIKPSFVYRVGSSSTFVAGSADSIEIYNGESGSLAKTYGTAGGTRAPTIEAPTVFPFKSKTTVYAGSCETNNPDPKGEVPANRAAMAFVELLPGGKAEPVIQLPALNLLVTNGSTPISGARVTTVDTKCPSTTSGVKREYTTEAGGHLARKVGTQLFPDAGMPWGEYKVCASAKIGSTNRRREATVSVKNLSEETPLNLNLATGTEASCP
ncbi:MAG: prepilin-type N-terminal cleavage/methylation domain-containing protein [Solirubrobacterales bacterium]